MRNQIDNLKNEMSKSKIDYEREKKKIINEHANEMESLKRELEEGKEHEMKVLKDKMEKLFKKKLED